MKKLWMIAAFAVFAGCSSNEEADSEQTNTNAGTENTEENQTNGAEEVEEEEETEEEAQAMETTSAENPTGNHGGNITQGGYMAMQGDTLYAVDYIDGGYGLFEMSLAEEGEPEMLLDVHASHLHPVEDGIFYVDNEEYVQPQGLHFYSFETEEVTVIEEGLVRNPQISDDGILFSAMLDDEEDGPMSLHRFDFESGETEDLGIYEINFAANDMYEIHQFEIFLHDAEGDSFEEEDAIADEATSPVFLDENLLYYNSFESANVMDMETEETTEIIDQQIAFFNAFDGRIFYSPISEEDADGNLHYMEEAGAEPEELGNYDSIYMFPGYSIARLDGSGVLTYDLLDHETGEWSTIYEDERG